MTTTTYQVTAKRWAEGWELHIADGLGGEVGVTQVPRIHNAEDVVRDYIALDLDIPPDSFEVRVVLDLEESLCLAISDAKQAAASANRAQEAAARKNRQVAEILEREGLNGREIAFVLQVSPQRISQLLPGRHHVRRSA
ncbi:hypothetical protein ACFY4C_37325 [Actinomadura viridis]|uniref:hypothetical protein n=1 Tax=Actinomadura viridis TaxID=58110 RepID=UPI0036B971FF